MIFDLLLYLLVLVLEGSAVNDLGREHLLGDVVSESISFIQHIDLAHCIMQSDPVARRHPILGLVLELGLIGASDINGSRWHVLPTKLMARGLAARDPLVTS